PQLSNARLRCEFGPRGLVALTDVARHTVYRLTLDEFRLTISGTAYDSRELPAPAAIASRTTVTYRWTAGAYRVDVVYELRPGWGFVSKQIFVAGAGGRHVERVPAFRPPVPAHMLPEWRLGPADTTPGMDEAEVETFTAMVRAFLIHPPAHPLNVFVGWTANDYQIDVATPAGRNEYARLLDRAAGLGAEYVVFAPSNSALSRREESVDDWSWEHVLWLGLGQKIRRGEWDAATGAIPPSVQALLDSARAKHVKLVAYVYPVLPFAGNPAWLVRAPGASTRRFASLGVRALRD